MIKITVLVSIALVSLCIFGVDIWMNGRTWLARIKIGRCQDPEIWRQRTVKVAKKWMIHMPTVKKTDQNRYILLDKLTGNYKNKTIQSWQIGGLYLGLGTNAEPREKIELEKRFINRETGNWITMPKEVDEALLAYAILKYTDDYSRIKPAMDTIFELIKNRVQENDGCVCYREEIPEIRFVDTIGFICPFLALYGKCYQREEAYFIVKQQLQTYRRNGMLSDPMLPVHAYDSKTGLPLGIYGWGRGTGWWMLGLIDTYEEWKTDWMEQYVIQTADSLLGFENESGGFSSNMILKNNIESSITAMAGYFYQQCDSIFHKKEYRDVSKRCVAALMKNTRRSGEIDFAQGDTKGIGIYSQTYDIMPFTQGMALRIGEITE